MELGQEMARLREEASDERLARRLAEAEVDRLRKRNLAFAHELAHLRAKAANARSDADHLAAEVDRLRADVLRYRDALAVAEANHPDALDEVDRLRKLLDTAMVFLPHCACGGDADHCTVCDLKRRVADRDE